MVKRKTTIKPAPKILTILAENIETEQYKLPKVTGFSYRTILRTLKTLEKNGQIKVVRTEPSRKGGKEKNIWALTPKGINHMYTPQTFDLEKFQCIASKHTGTLFFTDKIRDWHLTETPYLANIILNDFRWIIFSNNYKHAELEDHIVRLLIAVLFMAELEVATQKYVIFAQDILLQLPSVNSALPNQLRKEAKSFLENNTWAKKKIKKMLTDYIDYIERERAFISKFSETVKRNI